MATLCPRIWVQRIQRNRTLLLLEAPSLAILMLRRQFQFNEYHVLANTIKPATTTTTRSCSCRNEKTIVLNQDHSRERRHSFFSPTPSALKKEYQEWVSLWKKRDRRRIYLLGTEHGNPVSIKLTEQLVRNVQPKAVFVELDVGRITRFFPVPRPTYNDTYEAWNVVPHEASIVTWLFPPERNPFSINQGLGGQQEMGPTMFGERQIVFRKTAFQSGIEQEVKKISEFYCAIIEGQKIGAAIVLVDRIEGSKIIRLSFEADPPKNVESVDLPTMYLDLSFLLKSHASKADIKRWQSLARKYTPRWYETVISSRDDYMAVGLNSLVQFETIVAIMGKRHIPGVEERLQDFGWTQQQLV